MSWNHRILAHESNGEVHFAIHEVFYNEVGVPSGYIEKSVTVGGDDMKAITWTLRRMLECRKKPILWAGDRFPQEYL